MDIHNRPAEETTVHWHGLEVPGEVDGGPQGIIAPGASRGVNFTPASGPRLAGSTRTSMENRSSGGDGAGGTGTDF